MGVGASWCLPYARDIEASVHLPMRSWASLGLSLPTVALRKTSQTLEH